MKWRDLDQKTIERLQKRCNKDMKAERIDMTETKTIATWRRAYSKGFLVGYEFHENQSQKTRTS